MSVKLYAVTPKLYPVTPPHGGVWFTQTMLMHLTSLSLIKIRSEQAAQFLQGQLTCDLREIDTEHSRLGAYCDHKGRMLTDFRLYFDGEDYYVLLNQSLLEKTILQLKKFAIFSKVTIEDASDLFIIAGYLKGHLETDHRTQNFSHLGELLIAVDDVIIKENLILMRVPSLQPRYLIIVKKSRFAELNLHFDLKDIAANDRWQLENIRAGIPSIHPQTSEMFTPHMINYHLINGISFSKGCFLGQEIIARTQHLGKLKRHTYRMQVSSDKRPQAGDPIFSDQQEIGTVVDASPDPDLKSGYQLLAMIHDETFLERGLFLKLGPGNSNERLILQTLPYSY